MKKLLFSMFAALCAFGANASTEVTFDFDKDATALFGIEGRSSGSNATYVADGEFQENGVATVDGVTITVEASPADATTRNRLWSTSPVLRMYNGALTVSAPGHNITTIAFSAGSNFNIGSVSSGALEGKTWVSNAKVDEVVFTISKNTQLKSMTVTLDGEIGEEPEPIVIAGNGEGTAESPYDVERAVSLIENDAVSSTEVYVTGTISSIDEINVEYGNATYNIAQGDKTLKIYRGKGLNGAAFTTGDEIKVGDVVVVCGVLVTSDGGEINTGSKIVSINGESSGSDDPVEPPYTAVGNGTAENPYTVDDIKHLDILTSDGEKYWVKGIILGSASSATKLNDTEKAVDTNIALGMTESSEEFIPVALPAGDARTALGVYTNPGNIGKEVMVYGTLEKYFSVAGVKNVTEWKLGTTSINSITADNSGVRYFNIQGVEVANPQAGQLYIRVSGKKATKVVF